MWSLLVSGMAAERATPDECAACVRLAACGFARSLGSLQSVLRGCRVVWIRLVRGVFLPGVSCPRVLCEGGGENDGGLVVDTPGGQALSMGCDEGSPPNTLKITMRLMRMTRQPNNASKQPDRRRRPKPLGSGPSGGCPCQPPGWAGCGTDSSGIAHRPCS